MFAPVRSLRVAEKYQLLEELGRGGMGTVWRAYSSVLGSECALKMVLPDARGRDERVRLRLLREARIAAKLRSPYVVTVYDVGEWEGGPFIAMELLEGRSLREWLAELQKLPIPTTVELCRQLALGLDKAHQAGLVHRDLKPDNIFVVETQPLLVKILDFGIAKDMGILGDNDVHTTTGVITGTPLYMSPEQANASKDIDFRSDLWSLAAICFECLVGRAPFVGDTLLQLLLNIVSGPLPVPSELNPALPPTFDEFWARSADRNPKGRPPSALAFAEGLRESFGELAEAETEVETTPEPPVGGGRRDARRAWWAAGAVLMSLVGGYAWVQLRSPTMASSADAQSPGALLVRPRPAAAQTPGESTQAIEESAHAANALVVAGPDTAQAHAAGTQALAAGADARAQTLDAQPLKAAADLFVDEATSSRPSRAAVRGERKRLSIMPAPALKPLTLKPPTTTVETQRPAATTSETLDAKLGF